MDEYLGAAAAPEDPILGLDFGSKRFYSHLSTLVNGSQYFASRFNGNLQPGGYLGKDEFGRDVYFVDRDGELFSFVLAFLRNNAVEIPAYHDNPSLWKALRREGLFFGVDGLVSQLQVTFSCRPSIGVKGGDRGVLYFLGTNHGRSDTYKNPYMAGKVDVLGCVDYYDSDDEMDDLMEEGEGSTSTQHVVLLEPCTWRSYSKANFVQYRHPVDKQHGPLSLTVGCSGLNFCDGDMDEHIIIDMRTVCVRPSHYSMRGSYCLCLTSDWTFEGSTDCQSWKCLHQSTSECHIEMVSDATKEKLYRRMGFGDGQNITMEDLKEQELAYLTDQAEQLLRGTWSIPDYKSNDFYRYFRIRKASDSGCLHATSFELFGDVNECPEE